MAPVGRLPRRSGCRPAPDEAAADRLVYRGAGPEESAWTLGLELRDDRLRRLVRLYPVDSVD